MAEKKRKSAGDVGGSRVDRTITQCQIILFDMDFVLLCFALNTCCRGVLTLIEERYSNKALLFGSQMHTKAERKTGSNWPGSILLSVVI